MALPCVLKPAELPAWSCPLTTWPDSAVVSMPCCQPAVKQPELSRHAWCAARVKLQQQHVIHQAKLAAVGAMRVLIVVMQAQNLFWLVSLHATHSVTAVTLTTHSHGSLWRYRHTWLTATQPRDPIKETACSAQAAAACWHNTTPGWCWCWQASTHCPGLQAACSLKHCGHMTLPQYPSNTHTEQLYSLFLVVHT